MTWTLSAVAKATQGTLVGSDLEVSGFSTDSRSIGPGQMFVAIRGEHFDGHDYCSAALASGAVAVLSESGRSDVEPRVDVVDTQAALLDLAVAHRDQLQCPVIAITGSTGKTSTKDMLAAAMGPGAFASPASYNNEIGVPLTVLGTPLDATALVAEVGSRGRGHIAELAPAVRPDVTVITNLGLVHLETFGTTDDLAKAKSELIDALSPDGVAVLPQAEDRLSFGGKEVRFGDGADADVWVSDVALDDLGRPRFTMHVGDQPHKVGLQMAGAHQALNAAAAVAAALAAGREIDAAIAGVAAASGSPWRMEVHPGRFTVVNDAYNANPTSVEAALRTTASLGEPLVAVLGVMAELGPISEAEHKRIGSLAAALGFHPVIVVGDAPGLSEGAGDSAVQARDADAAFDGAIVAAHDGAAVLVKGSRVAGLELLAQRLVEAAA